MTKEIILFDTNDYQEDWGFMEDDLQYILDEYTNKPRGEVAKWVLLSTRTSRYGSISNHGQTGYLDLRSMNLASALLSATQHSERIVVSDYEGELQVDYHDHDGTHHAVVKSVSKSRGDHYNNVIEYRPFDKKVAYIEKLPTLKTKKSAMKQLQK